MRKISVVLILIMFALGACASVSTNASDNEEEQVKKALDGFYSSLNAMLKGNPEPAKLVWSQSDDIAYMGADGGYEVGWEAFYANWVKQAHVGIGGSVIHSKVIVNTGKDIAVTHQLVKSVDPSGQSTGGAGSLRASSVFRKEEGKWMMIGHHVDVIPELKKEINN